jgi:hypothetical protein
LPESIPIFDSFSVTQASATDHLLFAMAAQVKHNIVLTETELLALKSWLVQRAEDFDNNHYIEVGISNGQEFSELLILLGKNEAGEIVFWHPPLPWPKHAAA